MRSLVAKMAVAAVLCFTFLSSSVAWATGASAGSAAGVVGIRIDTSDTTALNAMASSASKVMDYGAFQWVIAPRSAYDAAIANGVSFSYSPVDYRLTLGEQSFDPTIETPELPADLTAEATTGLTARLVQVAGPTRSRQASAMRSPTISRPCC